MIATTTEGAPASDIQRPRWLFWTCFIALIATSFGFITRSFVAEDWAVQFQLSESQKGELMGVGFWPFAISIILFSLVVDRIGYGKALAFAFVCHVSSILIIVTAEGYNGLYIGTFINSLGNGTVEAVINPVVAAMFPRAKTKWLNILHAGWPGGLVLGGLLTLSLTPSGVFAGLVGDVPRSSLWKWQIGLVLIPAVIYGVMMLRCRFPVSERVSAGVSYRDMLKEAGFLGALLAVFLIAFELTRVFMSDSFKAWDWGIGAIVLFNLGISMAVVLPYAIYVRFAPGRWLFVLLMVLMIPLATTELGTDGWIKDLMKATMQNTFGISGLWVLIYSATIMTVLRFVCGPLVKTLTPLGMLAMSSAFAAAGIAAMSQAAGAAFIIGAATIYAIGQTFFWPTTLGVVSERFPKGGALTLNTIAGVGMLGLGVFGFQFIGFVQDHQIHAELQRTDAALHETVIDEPKVGLFGPYQPLDATKVDALAGDPAQVVEDAKAAARSRALLIVSTLPVGMLLVYIGLIIYFKSRGGYEAELLTGHPDDEQSREMMGGVEGPVE